MPFLRQIIPNLLAPGIRQFVLTRAGAPQTLANLCSDIGDIPEGATIRVFEAIELDFIVIRPSLVGVDFDWVNQKKYIGTYRILNGSYVVEGGEGFITSDRFRIERTRDYLVSFPLSQSTHEAGSSAISACNFLLNEKGITSAQVPFVGVSNLTGTSVLKDSQDVFTSENYIDSHPLSQLDFVEPVLGQLGIAMKPGVQFQGYTYIREVSGVSETSRPARNSTPVCTVPNACDTLFDAFIAGFVSRPPVISPEPGNRFKSFPEALAYLRRIYPSLPQTVLSPVVSESDFRCPDGSIRKYFSAGLLPAE